MTASRGSHQHRPPGSEDPIEIARAVLAFSCIVAAGIGLEAVFAKLFNLQGHTWGIVGYIGATAWIAIGAIVAVRILVRAGRSAPRQGKSSDG